MESRAKILGHSVHQLSIVVPLGSFTSAVVFDVIGFVRGGETFSTTAFWVMALGIAGGAFAAPFGWIDWFAIPASTRAKVVGLFHGVTNVVVMLGFLTSVALRWENPGSPPVVAVALSIAAFALSLLGGWLGGELVSRLGVGVYDGAHLDSPSSLSGRPASEGGSGANLWTPP